MKVMEINAARSLASWLDVGALAAAVWRISGAGEDREDRKAAAGIDLVYRKVWMRSWTANHPMPVHPDVPLLVLAYCDTPRREETWRRLSEGLEVAPSAEVVAMEIQERAWREGINWDEVEEQLESIYGEDQYNVYTPWR